MNFCLVVLMDQLIALLLSWLYCTFAQADKLRQENTNDLSVAQAITIVMDRHPELK